MLPFHEVKKKFGVALGEKILQDKKTLEQNKKPGDATVYYMPHPDAPTNLDTQFLILRVFNSHVNGALL